MPGYFRIRYRNTRLQITPGTLAVLDSLKDCPTLICPNHSHREDGELIFWLSSALHMKFDILTAREIFENYGGLSGLILKRLGCFSVSRGMHDSKAVEFTEQLLEASSAKIVIFPEGEISYNSSDLLALESGAVYMGLEACRHLLKAEKPADVYLLPLAIRYEYLEDVNPSCATAVAKLERWVNMAPPSESTVRERAMIMAEHTLLMLEARFNLTTDSDFDVRLQQALAALVDYYARLLNCFLPPISVLGKLHILQSKVLDLQLGGRSSLDLHQIQRELMQAVTLKSLSSQSFSEEATNERFADAVTVLELYYLGASSDKGHRRVTIGAGEPLNLLNYIQDYNHTKSKTIQVLTEILASRLRRQIRQLQTPLRKLS